MSKFQRFNMDIANASNLQDSVDYTKTWLVVLPNPLFCRTNWRSYEALLDAHSFRGSRHTFLDFALKRSISFSVHFSDKSLRTSLYVLSASSDQIISNFIYPRNPFVFPASPHLPICSDRYPIEQCPLQMIFWLHRVVHATSLCLHAPETIHTLLVSHYHPRDRCIHEVVFWFLQ